MPPTIEEVRAQQEKLRELQRRARQLLRGGPPAAGDGSAAAAHRDKMAARSRSNYSAVSNIAPLPPVADPERKRRCGRSLLRFLVTYFPHSTGLSRFSRDHHRVIRRLQKAILGGGRFLNLVYRGFAKTTIAENAVLWATVYGHRKYAALFGADLDASRQNIDSIKRELEDNELLAADFPEVCHPVACLEGKHSRCPSQHIDGARTVMEWKQRQIVLPTVAESLASGAVIICEGITAASRGMKHKQADGQQQRPDLVLIDDPQTDGSAHSRLQCRKRIDTLYKTILRLTGHRKRMAVVINATPICRDDMVDQLCDPKAHPSWQRERVPMVRHWSSAHDSHWLGEYKRLRTTFPSDRPGADLEAAARATAYYAEHRAKMDAGCVVSWDSCFDPACELSAIQHAYNMLIDDGPQSFASESQMEPLAEPGQARRLEVKLLGNRCNGRPRGAVPHTCQRLTLGCDVHQEVLYWLLAGWEPNFAAGYIVDYGSWPQQPVDYFPQSKPPLPLSAVYPGHNVDGAIYAGLEALVSRMLAATFARDDGATVPIDVALVDTGWHPDPVAKLVRAAGRGPQLRPSRGAPLKPTSKPFPEYKPEAGVTIGRDWLLRPAKATQLLTCEIDTGRWKTTLRDWLLAPIGNRSAITLFGSDASAHRMLFDHLSAESAEEVTGPWGKVEVWSCERGRDNHLWDCLVLALVAASVAGLAANEWVAGGPAPARSGSWFAQQKRRRR